MKAIFCRETLWDDPHALSTNYLARALARRGWEILWLTRPWHPWGLLLPRGWARKAGKVRLWARGAASPGRNHVQTYAFAVLLPYRRLPLLRSAWVGRCGLRFSLPPLRWSLRRFGFQRPDLLVVSDLAQLSVLDLVEARRTILHVTDDYLGFDRTPPSALEVERWATRKADLVVTPQPSLASLLRERHDLPAGKIVILPHGVEPSELDGRSAPASFRRLPRPRVVFVGALSDWVDWDLLRSCAAACPRVTFALIGPVTTFASRTKRRIASLARSVNVRLLGPLPHRDAMACLAEADAGLLPFRVDSRAQLSAPMKLVEYQAAGLPVVSTIDFTQTLDGETAPPLTFAPEAASFASAVTTAVSRTAMEGEALRADGRAFAERHSWDRRLDSLLSRLAV